MLLVVALGHSLYCFASLGYADQRPSGNTPFPYGSLHGKALYKNHRLSSLLGGSFRLVSNVYLKERGWGKKNCCSRKLQRFGVFLCFLFQITIQEWFVR